MEIPDAFTHLTSDAAVPEHYERIRTQGKTNTSTCYGPRAPAGFFSIEPRAIKLTRPLRQLDSLRRRLEVHTDGLLAVV
ncbi:hypothetical protein E2C01_082455 [Portunus trituberculatus]|uniref:Uncharacterized protein n=1 Tax=Portunus trituberculatus TaxID=210409 RepID=A0A5B7J3W2_PORTR|nr:hypothetical protein [Portunus trituberculatus]